MKNEAVVIYHRDADGFGAAYSAWKYLGEAATYHSCQYGESFDFGLCGGKFVYILDFSFSLDEMTQMHSIARAVNLLDHHESAKKNLHVLPYCEFSDRAGCIMAWELFYPRDPIPALLLYIEDRDLWRFNLPKSREVSYGLGSYQFDFKTWDNIIKKGEEGVEELANDGAAIMRHIDMNVDRLVANNRRYVTIDGQKAWAVNCPLYQSEIAGKLAEMTPVGAVYYDSGDKRIFSLRSRHDECDVSEMAVKYGGGGHKKASGFKVPI